MYSIVVLCYIEYKRVKGDCRQQAQFSPGGVAPARNLRSQLLTRAFIPWIHAQANRARCWHRGMASTLVSSRVLSQVLLYLGVHCDLTDMRAWRAGRFVLDCGRRWGLGFEGLRLRFLGEASYRELGGFPHCKVSCGLKVRVRQILSLGTAGRRYNTLKLLVFLGFFCRNGLLKYIVFVMVM